jgi:hypothetical protein
MLQSIKGKLDQLQYVKLKRINKLHNSFVINLDQIYYPSPINQISNTCLFTQQNLSSLFVNTSQLKLDIRTIELEKNQLFISQESLIKKLSILRQAKNNSIKELNESFNLKFGEVIDLNILDSLKSTKKL